MGVRHLLQARFDRLCRRVLSPTHGSAIIAIAVVVAVASLGIAEAAVRVQVSHVQQRIAALTAGRAQRPAPVERTIWEGADLDGDGQPDIANPTGKAPRQSDAYGEGRFHASRDGGEREHEGVDYVATAGQPVEAPISGYVAKIGYAYPGDQTLRYVEIDNPALHLTARVFYVDPEVAVGDTVAVGRPIGQAHTLQHRYPRGITDHVHLEIANGRGRKLDAGTLIVARNVVDDRFTAD